MSIVKILAVLNTLYCCSSGVLGDPGYNVTYSSTSVCGIKGSVMDIPCTYTYPSDRQIQKTFWHISSGNREDLSLDSRYLGRVEYLGDKVENCTLRLKDLRESDTEVKYRFRIITDNLSGRFSGEEVSLALTDLHASVSPDPIKVGQRATLTCSATCSLSNNPTYIWYWNSKPVSNSHTTTSSNTLTITSVRPEDVCNYSCAVRGHEGHQSPPVCVSGWSVTPSPQSICALKGSSVELHCYYTYPCGQTVTKTYWFITWPKGREPSDLMEDGDYQGRINYTRDNENIHTLTIRNLTLGDSEGYRFRLRTDDPKGKISTKQILTLTVTGLQVKVNHAPVKEGDKVALTCSATCRLSNNPTYIWYRNSQPLSNSHTADNRLIIDSARPEDAGRYSCAVQGHEIHSSSAEMLNVRYDPRNTSVSVLPSGDINEGSSVTLTCSSDANPPAHTYTWYRQTGNQSTQVGLSQNHSFPNISSEQSGLYYCVAENVIGNDSSTVVEINVTYGPRNTSVSVIPSGDIIEGSSVTLTCSSDANPAVHNYTWFTNKHGSESGQRIGEGLSYSITNISTEHSGLYYCKAENKYGARDSSATFLDVYYSPRKTSATRSSSGAHQESVILTCSSDAHPPVHNFTWYRTDGNGTVLQGTGRTLNLTLNLNPDVGGLYHCEAQNEVGSENSTGVRIYLPGQFSDPGLPRTLLFISVGSISAVALLLVIVLVCWRAQKTSSTKTSEDTQSVTLEDSNHFYSNTFMDLGTGDGATADHHYEGIVPYASVQFKPNKQQQESSQEEDMHYASVQFTKHTPESTGPETPVSDSPQEETQYAAVNLQGLSAATQSGSEPVIYSTVQRKPKPEQQEIPSSQ